MTDISVAIASAEIALRDVAKQAAGLAQGLQNAAPSDKTNSPNKSVQYLFEIAEDLNDVAGKCKKLLSEENKEQANRFSELANMSLLQDKNLREKYQIGDKFRFIRDRLNVLLANVEEMLSAINVKTTQKKVVIADDDMVAYVYLFNAQGITLQTWHKMVNKSVFYEYSVNRPIYINKTHIESFINRKTNPTQHGYLTVVIKKQDISPAEGSELLKDIYDNPMIKVKEGSLHFNKLIEFTHNGHDYIVNDDGGLVKKN